MNVQLHLQTEKANGVTAVAASRGYAIPTEVVQAAACRLELGKILAAPPQMPALTSDPKKLRASLQNLAIATRDTLDLQQAGEVVQPQLDAAFSGATFRAIPAWITALQADFSKSWESFRKLWPVAPETLNTYSTDEEAASHAQLLRATGELDAALNARVTFGSLIREEGADARNVHLVVTLPAVPDDPSTIEAAWRPLGTLADTWLGGGVQLTTGTRPPAEGIAKWSAIAWADLPVSLADITQLEQRTHHRDAWSEAMSRHMARGGMPYSADHTYATL